MTLALIANEALGLLLLVVVLCLLAGAILRSRTDEQRLARAARRQARDRRRVASSGRPRANWAPRPDAS
jgi:Tfp pilus assembly protein PilX